MRRDTLNREILNIGTHLFSFKNVYPVQDKSKVQFSSPENVQFSTKK